MTVSPYADLPDRAFWRHAVAARAPLDPGDLYRPKFPVARNMRVMTAGSCFAQHVGRALRGAGFNVIDAEPLPRTVATKAQERFGYGIYSARYGNIYTVAQLLQLIRETLGECEPADPIWERDDRFFDAQRPGIEPDGLGSPDEVLRQRAEHLRAVATALRSADLLVFTLGLTEAWQHTASGTVFPTAPGTIAGRFDPDIYSFVNYNAISIYRDFVQVIKLVRGFNPRCRFLVTVSPVPLTATASGQHVEVATCYSKSVLRSVCGMLYDERRDVDYFPSYELITSANSRGVYFEANKRSVTAKGVETAMRLFLAAHGAEAAGPAPAPAGRAAASVPEIAAETDVQCEEALLDAFAK